MNGHIELLETLCTLEQEQLHDYLLDTLLEYYNEQNVIEDHGQFLYAKGNLDVLLVAHLDTVHKVKPTLDEIFYDEAKGVMWSPRGIGGDDRCGVFIILNILFAGYRPHIAFTWNEEIGCVGSRNMVQVFDPKEQMGANINFAIQFDRRGHQEAVYYDLYNPEFEQYITSFGFDTKIGSFTDICEICPDWGFAGVNLSAGYANEHTTNEMIFVATINDTFTKACKILDDQSANPKFFDYKELPKGKWQSYNKSQGFKPDKDYDDYWKQKYGWWDDEDDAYYYGLWDKSPKSGSHACELCAEEKAWYELSPCEDLQKVCNQCYNIYIGKSSYEYYEDEFVDDLDEDDDGNDLVISQIKEYDELMRSVY